MFSEEEWKSFLPKQLTSNQVIANAAFEQVQRDMEVTLPMPCSIKEGETIRCPNPGQHHRFKTFNLCYVPKEQEDEEEEEHSSEDEKEEVIPEPLKPSQFYDAFVHRSEKQCTEEGVADQRSELWLQARAFCITASQFGSAVGKNPYQSPDNLVMEKLWKGFKGNEATQWGNDHEPHARESFQNFFKVFATSEKYTLISFQEPNLVKFAAEPWIAVSPDGLVSYTTAEGEKCTDLIEYKCPAYLRNTDTHPYSKHPSNTPPYYACQMQGIMGYYNSHLKSQIKRCWFVVWQPHQCWITLHAEQKDMYKDIHEKLQSWYFSSYLPRLTHKYNKTISIGELKPHETVTC